MASAGQVLRGERIKRARSLADLAKFTCISTRYLTAIEEDDSKTLPGHFFHRSFIRQYAAAIGLDDSETKRILDLLEPVPEIDPIPALNLSQQFAEVEQQSKPLARIPARGAAFLLFVVMLACSGLYAIWNKSQESAEAPIEPSTATPAQPAPPPTKPNAEVGVSANSFEQLALPQDGTINVNLAATEKTWVSLSSAGRTVFAGVLNAAQTKDFALSEDGRLLTGNAAGLDVRMNGRSIGRLGSRGQVRVVLFRHDQYEILSPSEM
jgi:cytoskeleton protein RodZ